MCQFDGCKCPMNLLSTHYQPPLDLPLMSLTVRDGKLLLLDWFDKKTHELLGKLGGQVAFVPADDLSGQDDNQRVARQLIGELDEYFAGVRKVFAVPLDLSVGTPFQIKVWQALLQIPYGQTISYAQLAGRIGKPTAYRACANANGKNPISLIVPCHRVIASDGTLGGYTGGVAIKKTLLKIEGVLPKP